jgi:hypothetical protein
VLARETEKEWWGKQEERQKIVVPQEERMEGFSPCNLKSGLMSSLGKNH